MPLYKKLIIFVFFIVFCIMVGTIALVDFESQTMMVNQAQKKAMSYVVTVNSALQSGLPYYQLQDIVNNFKKQDTNLRQIAFYQVQNQIEPLVVIGSQNQPTILKDVEQFYYAKKYTSVRQLGDTVRLISQMYTQNGVEYIAFIDISIKNDIALVNSLVLKIFAIGLLSILIGILILWYASVRLVSKPLFIIAKAAKGIAEGSLTVSLDQVAKRRDEIGILSRGFVSMATQLHTLIGGIHQAVEQMNLSFEELFEQSEKAFEGANEMTEVVSELDAKEDILPAKAMAIRSQIKELRKNLDQYSQAHSLIRNIALEAIEFCDENKIEQWQDADFQSYVEQIRELNGEQPFLLQAMQQAIVALIELLADVKEINEVLNLDLETVSEAVHQQLLAVKRVDQSATLVHQMSMDLRHMMGNFELEI